VNAPLPDGIEPETARALMAGARAVQSAGGVFLTTEQAAELAKVAIMAAEPWLRLMTTRITAEQLAASSNEMMHAVGLGLGESVRKYREELDG
jgi:hypothetical protein